MKSAIFILRWRQVLFEHRGHDWIQAHLLHQMVLEVLHTRHLCCELSWMYRESRCLQAVSDNVHYWPYDCHFRPSFCSSWSSTNRWSIIMCTRIQTGVMALAGWWPCPLWSASLWESISDLEDGRNFPWGKDLLYNWFLLWAWTSGSVGALGQILDSAPTPR